MPRPGHRHPPRASRPPTISATGVPTDAAAPSSPAEDLASSPDGGHIQQHQDRIISESHVSPPHTSRFWTRNSASFSPASPSSTIFIPA